MKKTLIIIIATLSAVNIHAQIQFGVKGGLNLSNLILSPSVQEASYNLKPGFNAGVLVHIPLSNHFGLQPEILYSGQGSNGNTNFENITIRLQYLTIPLLLKYAVSSRFFAEIGPQAGFLLSARKKVHTTDYVLENPDDPYIDHAGDNIDIRSYYRSVDLSGVIGIGYLFTPNIGAVANYNLSILNTVTSHTGSVRNSVIQIDFFYFLKQGNKH